MSGTPCPFGGYLTLFRSAYPYMWRRSWSACVRGRLCTRVLQGPCAGDLASQQAGMRHICSCKGAVYHYGQLKHALSPEFCAALKLLGLKLGFRPPHVLQCHLQAGQGPRMRHPAAQGHASLNALSTIPSPSATQQPGQEEQAARAPAEPSQPAQAGQGEQRSQPPQGHAGQPGQPAPRQQMTKPYIPQAILQRAQAERSVEPIKAYLRHQQMLRQQLLQQQASSPQQEAHAREEYPASSTTPASLPNGQAYSSQQLPAPAGSMIPITSQPTAHRLSGPHVRYILWKAQMTSMQCHLLEHHSTASLACSYFWSLVQVCILEKGRTTRVSSCKQCCLPAGSVRAPLRGDSRLVHPVSSSRPKRSTARSSRRRSERCICSALDSPTRHPVRLRPRPAVPSGGMSSMSEGRAC